MACWKVCPAGCEDFSAVARMGGDDLDGWLGAAWLYLRTLRNVETPPCADCKLDSANPKTAAVGPCGPRLGQSAGPSRRSADLLYVRSILRAGHPIHDRAVRLWPMSRNPIHRI